MNYKEVERSIPELNIRTNALVALNSNANWRLVCIPGSPSKPSLFQRLLKNAPKDLDIVVVNRLGYHPSHSAPFLNFEDQIKVVEPFLEKKRNILLGVSYGGAISLKAALEYPSQIDGVVTVAALISEPHDYARKLVDSKVADYLSSLAPRSLKHSREEIQARRSQIGPLIERLSDLSIPVEVLHGNLDNLVPKSDAAILTKAIGANAHYEEVRGGTHYIELQMPEKILDAVRRVIQRLESPL